MHVSDCAIEVNKSHFFITGSDFITSVETGGFYSVISR